jgi:hypothetical protein
VVSDLDQPEHQPQVARDRRLTRCHDDQVSIDAAADQPQLPSALGDRRRLRIGRSLKSLRDSRERQRRQVKLILESFLDLPELTGERLAHTRLLAHETLIARGISADRLDHVSASARHFSIENSSRR